ncbi:hypothetical protein I3842_13G146300 [Carya illinoinensis]|uniref:Uncharacterized protein n=1 Tax=Carya illinoinensis TaxID=32201 RepID=A0A922AMS6_CARIL|nr:hypothetical protein I3842_13G146300 [Carya illinoinensis]
MPGLVPWLLVFDSELLLSFIWLLGDVEAAESLRLEVIESYVSPYRSDDQDLKGEALRDMGSPSTGETTL